MSLTTTRLDRQDQSLTLTHQTDDGYTGILCVPTDPFSSLVLEQVYAPHGALIHEMTCPIPMKTVNLAHYVRDLTYTHRQTYRRVS
jgi:hypothetical protein